MGGRGGDGEKEKVKTKTTTNQEQVSKERWSKVVHRGRKTDGYSQEVKQPVAAANTPRGCGKPPKERQSEWKGPPFS